jgi:hypothetical protein
MNTFTRRSFNAQARMFTDKNDSQLNDLTISHSPTSKDARDEEYFRAYFLYPCLFVAIRGYNGLKRFILLSHFSSVTETAFRLSKYATSIRLHPRLTAVFAP